LFGSKEREQGKKNKSKKTNSLVLSELSSTIQKYEIIFEATSKSIISYHLLQCLKKMKKI
jgi:hypothetical protein